MEVSYHIVRNRVTLGATGVALLLLCLLDVAARSWPIHDLIFPSPGRVELLDIDSYYHLRQARLAMEHFPRLVRDDHLDAHADYYGWGENFEVAATLSGGDLTRTTKELAGSVPGQGFCDYYFGRE